MNNNIPFRVVKGLEETIMSDKYPIQEGFVYFATDTKKIYLDTNKARLSMGGNTGIYYGNKDFEGLEGPEFFFDFDSINGDTLPNINDLIINSDGCFYKVLEKLETELKTERLTIAGTGSGGTATTGNIKLSVDGGVYKTVLSGQPFQLSFIMEATDADGENSGNGRYEIKVNNVVRKSGIAKNSALLDTPDPNVVEVGDLFLLTGDYTVQIVCYGYTGGASEASISKRIYIKSTEFKVEWDYEDDTINNINNNFSTTWKVSAPGADALSIITIDDTYTISTTENVLTIPQEELASYGLTHGVHKFEIKAIAFIGADAEEKTSNSIIKNIIFYDTSKPEYIVACDFFEREIQQYSTVQLPIRIYHVSNTIGNATVEFKVNSALKDTRENCKNLEKIVFSYTPEEADFVQLQFISGGTTLNLTLNVTSLDINVSEVKGYEFKFKATEFSSNEEIKKWKCNNQKIEFSRNFDWINGGLKTGEDDIGPYFKIQAGSYMTVPYQLFGSELKETGACFKVIFKASNCRDYDANVLTNYDRNTGLKINAQNGIVQAGGVGLNVAHCEDSYIEYEFDVCEYSEKPEDQYLTIWVDGVPAAVTAYSRATSFVQTSPQNLKIGSDDCDVYIYLIKFYKKHLTSQEHLNNFIIDAPNAVEIKARYDRNNIFAKDHNNQDYISPTLLAKQNKECNVYTYTVPYIPTSKEDVFVRNENNDKVYECCSFAYYKGSDQSIRNYEGVKMRAQGTSSMSYGISAYNLDTKFPEAWALDDEAIKVNYFNTKVNVASCESANNALNQEWYNRYQPYKTQKRLQHRADNTVARDTMEFKPGVLFIQDNNTVTDSDTATSNNVFKEIDGYANLADNLKYPRMYSICNMGNSKKNTEVFHLQDLDNYPYECCVEVADNNTPAQQMIQVSGYDEVSDTEVALNLPETLFDSDGFVISGADWGTTTFTDATGETHTKDNKALWKQSLLGEKYFEFRYAPEDVEDSVLEDLSNRFLRLVYWFAKWNPANTLSEKDIIENLKDILYETKYQNLLVEKYNDIFKIESIDNIENILTTLEEPILQEQLDVIKNNAIVKVQENYPDLEDGSDQFNMQVSLTYYNSLLEEFGDYISTEMIASILTQIEYEYLETIKEEIVSIMLQELQKAEYNEIDTTTQETLIESYTNYIRTTKYTLSVPKTFTQAELTIPSITTFYSNYKRDDEILAEKSEPKLYDIEFKYDSKEYRAAQMLSEAGNYLIMDSIVYHYLFIERHTMVDNVAKNTFWNTEDGIHWDLTKNYDNDTADGTNNNGYLTFNYGQEIEHEIEIFNANQSAWLNFIRELPTIRENMYQALYNKKDGAWSAEPYLNMFTKEWQDVIPEACWIEDFNRKYFRPRNIYGDEDYLVRLANGKKTHQRKQYEIYQEQYMDSKYKTNVKYGTSIQWRSKQDENKDKETNGKYKIGCKFTLYADGYFTAAIASGTNVNKHIRAKKGETVEFVIEQPTHFGDATCYLYSPNLYSKIENIEGLYPGNFNASSANKLRELTMIPEKGTQSQVLGSSSFVDSAGAATGKYLSFANNIEKIIIRDCKNANFEMDLDNCKRLKEIDTVGSAFTSYVIGDGAPVENFKIEAPQSLVMSNLYYLNKDQFVIKSYSNLDNILINNIDYNINDFSTKNISKKIVKGALEHNHIKYSLSNIGWKFDSVDDGITDTNIPLLDTLLSQTTISNAKKAESLIGRGIITNQAYNKDNSLNLYEKYGLTSSDDSTYPNFILEFEAENSKLYSIDIINGDGKTVWSRQVKSFDTISNDLLLNSALGEFDAAAAIKKSESNEEVYTFSNSWKYTTSSGKTGTIQADAQGDYWYLDLSKLQTLPEENIIIEPDYTSTTRYYTIKFYDNELNELHSINATYGTEFKDIKPSVIPFKDDQYLDLTKTYYLKGYSAINNTNSTINEDTWRVTADVELFTVFNEIDIYKMNYTQYLDIENTVLKGLLKNSNGDYIYQGKKILIPKEVTKIGQINNTNLTHIFIEPNSQLEIIQDTAFKGSQLQYFEFVNSIKEIQSEAFMNCKLQARNYNNLLKLPSSLERIGTNAFNSAFGKRNMDETQPYPLTIVIPATTGWMGKNAIAFLETLPSVTVRIGITQLSNLNLDSITSNIAYPIINSNDGNTYDISNVEFYTSKYNENSIINGISINTIFDSPPITISYKNTTEEEL